MKSSAEFIPNTKTGGRPASSGVIRGRYALSVGMPPDKPTNEGWNWTPLSSLARLESGHTPSRRHAEYWGGDIPWIGIKDATGNHGLTLKKTIQHTNYLGILNSSARVLPKNTVCLSRTASVGYVVVMGCPMATSQDFINWVCSENLDYRYLKYILLSEQESMLRFASGTTHQTIYFPEAKAFHVLIPGIDEQRRIADFLQSLDDCIAILHETNATLEAMAQAIFKSWFVDFDPVRAKAEGHQPERMDASTAALFPDSFEDSELGEVPAGWSVFPIGELVKCVGGATPSTKNSEFWEPAEFSWTTPKDLSGLQSPILHKTEKMVSSKGVLKISSGLLPAGTLLMSSRAPIGYLAISSIDVAVNQGYIAIPPGGKLSPLYLLHWCRQNMELIKSHANGSTFMEISKKAFRPLPALLPSVEVLAEFTKRVSPIFESIAANDRQINLLAEIRDTLLPKLISGEIRLPEAESIVRSVVNA